MAAACLAAPAAPAADRPNILWLTAEDICPHLGCYGDTYAVTPNRDRFATQAVRYSQAHDITGVCAPNRSCLITGVFPSRLGSHGMRSMTTLPANVKCFSEYLRAAGYYYTNSAKTDYNFAVPPDAWDACSRAGHYRNRRSGQPFFAVFNYEVCHESQIRVPEADYQRNTARLTPAQRHDPARAPLPAYHPDTPEVRRDWARYYDNITAVDYQVADALKELEDAGLAEEGRLSGPRARYFSPTKPVEELYENETDADQVNNRAADPKYRDTLERLRAECLRWMKATDDLGLLPEHEMLVRANGTTPWEIAANPRLNPLDALLSAAAVANQMSVDHVARLATLLVSPDSALRWWGAQGLVALGRDAKSAATALRKVLADESPPVRIAAAEAIGNLGDDATALPVLTKALQHESPLVRLEALNALDRFGARAAPALDAIKAARMKLDEQTARFISGVARTRGGVQPALQAQAYVAEYLNRMVDYVPGRIEQSQ